MELAAAHQFILRSEAHGRAAQGTVVVVFLIGAGVLALGGAGELVLGVRAEGGLP